METRVWELIRLFFLILVGAVLVFYLQPILYSSRMIALTDVDPIDWVNRDYTPAAGLAFAVSALLALAWYIIAAIIPLKGSGDVPQISWIWYVFLFLTVVSIFGALYLSRASIDARWSLFVLLFIDMVVVFWLSTAVSSPNFLKFTIPGAFFFRRLVGR